MFTHKVTTPPTLEPVTVDEVRELAIGNFQTGDISRDSAIAERIKTATKWLQNHLHRKIMRQTLIAYGVSFYADVPNFNQYQSYPPLKTNPAIRLDKGAVSVESITYLDNAGDRQTLDSSAYTVDLVAFEVIPAYNACWPSHRCYANSVQIEYLTGWETQADVPSEIKEAIRLIVGQWERFQHDLQGGLYPPGMPHLVKDLVSDHIDVRGWF